MHNTFLNIHLAHFKWQKYNTKQKGTIKKGINFVYSIENSLKNMIFSLFLHPSLAET